MTTFSEQYVLMYGVYISREKFSDLSDDEKRSITKCVNGKKKAYLLPVSDGYVFGFQLESCTSRDYLTVVEDFRQILESLDIPKDSYRTEDIGFHGTTCKVYSL